MMRSLHEITTGCARKEHRTGQPVRRNSYKAGTRENRLWRAFDKRERNARMRAAENYDRTHKQTGKRNGPLGHIGIEVLRELMRIIDFKTGRLEPSIRFLAEKLHRAPAAIHAALKRLRAHGFVEWIRRYEPIENPDAFGPQVRQVSNAYKLSLPKTAADMVQRLVGRSPVPVDEVSRRAEEEERIAEMLASLSAEELASVLHGGTALGEALARLGRAVDRNAITPGSLNPALRG